MAFLAFGAVAGGAAVWLQKIIKEEQEAREEKLELQTKEIACLRKQLRHISISEETSASSRTDPAASSSQAYEETRHSLQLKEELNTAIAHANAIEEKLNGLQCEKENVIKENKKLLEITEQLRKNEIQLDAKRKYLEQKCKDLQQRIESLDNQSKALEADKKTLESTLKDTLNSKNVEGRKALANELREELGILLTAYRAGCLDGGEAIDRFLATISQACPESNRLQGDDLDTKGKEPDGTSTEKAASKTAHSEKATSIPLRIKDELVKNAMKKEALRAGPSGQEKENGVPRGLEDSLNQDPCSSFVEKTKISSESLPAFSQIPAAANHSLRSPPFLKNRRPLRDCGNISRKSDVTKNQASKPANPSGTENFTLDDKGDAVFTSRSQNTNRHQAHRRKHLHILRQSKENVEVPVKNTATAANAAFYDENSEINNMTVSKTNDGQIKPVHC